MISLTRNQRKIVEHLEAMVKVNEEYSESASRIREQLNNFISLPAMITNLSIMSGYGILTVKLEDGVNGREIEKYTLNSNITEKDTILFPSFEVLSTKAIKVSKAIKPIKATKVHTNSESGVKQITALVTLPAPCKTDKIEDLNQKGGKKQNGRTK